MPLTTPGPTRPLGYTQHSATFTDTHSRMHGRTLLKGSENVRAYGALGNGAADDTAAFTDAFAAAGANGSIFVPSGDYRVDPLTFPAVEGLKIWGEGSLQSKIHARTNGQSHVIKLAESRYAHFQNVGIYGRGIADTCDGLVIEANSQANLLVNVDVFNCRNGIWLEEPGGGHGGGASQVDKNTYINCRIAQCTVGLWIHAANSQCQLWLGGDYSNNTTSVRLSRGSYQQIGGMVQHSGGTGTAYLIDDGAYCMVLENVVTEAEDVSISMTGMTAPAAIYLNNCIFAGDTTCVDIGSSGIVDAQYTRFNTGAINAGDNSTFIDKFCVLDMGAAWVPGVNAKRVSTDAQGTHYFYNSTTKSGTIKPDASIVLKSKAGVIADSDVVGAENGQMALDTSNSRIYVRIGGVWKFAQLT